MAKKKNKYNYKEVAKKIREYTDCTEIPIIKELCVQEDWCYTSILDLQYKNDKIKHEIKRLVNKKEANLEKGMLYGYLSQRAAIFSLKQLGWRENQVVEIVNNNEEDELSKSIRELIANSKK